MLSHNSYTSPNITGIVYKNKMSQACSMHWGEEEYSVLVGKPEGNIPIERDRVGRIILKWMRGNGLDWYNSG
jgi:hypothetical protein